MLMHGTFGGEECGEKSYYPRFRVEFRVPAFRSVRPITLLRQAAGECNVIRAVGLTRLDKFIFCRRSDDRSIF